MTKLEPGRLSLDDINFMIYVTGYIEKIQKDNPDKELDFRNIYHRLSILTREAVQEYVNNMAKGLYEGREDG